MSRPTIEEKLAERRQKIAQHKEIRDSYLVKMARNAPTTAPVRAKGCGCSRSKG